ncbi:hypothetical protein SOPP22_02945 [Shewanella sp. OPT22]|nr:hypothetical protein SOPP22_02945 [Shewanella sp. OPT22]
MGEPAVTCSYKSNAIDVANKLLKMQVPELQYKSSLQCCTIPTSKESGIWRVTPPKIYTQQAHSNFHEEKDKPADSPTEGISLELVAKTIPENFEVDRSCGVQSDSNQDSMKSTSGATGLDHVPEQALGDAHCLHSSKQTAFDNTSLNSETSTRKAEAISFSSKTQEGSLPQLNLTPVFFQQVEQALNSGHNWLRYIESGSKNPEKPLISTESIETLPPEAQNKLLNYAVKNNELELFKALTRNRSKSELEQLMIATESATPNLALCHAAVETQALDIIDYLTKQEFDFNKLKDSEGLTPFVYSVKHGRTKSLEKLLKLKTENRENPDEAHFPFEHSVLILAIDNNDAVSSKLLIIAGANVDQPYAQETSTLLKYAILKNKTDVIPLLIDHSKNLDHEDTKGEHQGLSAFELAAKQEQFTTLDSLIDKAPELAKQFETKIRQQMGGEEHRFDQVKKASEHNCPHILTLLLGRTPKDPSRIEELELHRLMQEQFNNPEVCNDIARLVANKIDINFKNEEGFTPLQMAIKNNNIHAAKALVEAGADIREITCKAKTHGIEHMFNSLSLAISLGRTEIVKILIIHLKNTPNFNINSARKETWHTPMLIAVRCNYLSLVKFLHEQGATVHVDRNESTCFTPIKLAIHFGHKDIVRWMMEQTTDYEHKSKGSGYDDFTCLDFAAKTLQFDIFNELLGKGAKLNNSKYKKENLQKLGWGRHPFSILTSASMHQCPHIVAVIIERKPDDSGVIAELELHRLTSKEFDNLSVPKDITKALQQNPDINFQDASGNTPLQAAIKNNNVSAALTLINANADLNTIKNNKGQTALMLACEVGNLEIVDLLLDKVLKNTEILTLNEQIDDEGFGLVATAARNGHLSILKLLDTHKISLDTECTGDHNTPLKLSIANGHDETALWLIDKLAFDTTETLETEGKTKDDVEQIVNLKFKPTGKLDHKNSQGAYIGHTALDTAAQKKDLPIVERLLVSGADKTQCKTQIFEKLGFGKNDYEILKNASERQCAIIIKHCIGREPNPTFTIEELELHRLIQFDNPFTADLICKHAKVPGVNLDFKNADGDTPLQAAIKASNFHAVKALIAANADISTITDSGGRSSFAIACMWGPAEIVELFIKELKKDSSFDINAQLLENWYTPMGLAASNNLVSVARVLQKHGATVSAPCRPPLNHPIKIAISKGKSDVAMWLISQATEDELNEPNMVSAEHSEFKFTALDYAAKSKHYKLVDMLYQHGATQAKTDVLTQLDWGESDYSRLKHASEHQCLYIMQHILKRDLSSIHNVEELELHEIAAKNERLSRSQLNKLKKPGVNLEFVDDKGYTPLNRAVENGHLKAVTALLELGAKPDCRENNHKRNAIQTAAIRNRCLELQALLNNFDGDIEAAPSDGSGWTTFALAIYKGNIKIAEILVKHDKTILKHFEKGDFTHLMLALHYDQKPFASWLISQGIDTLKCNSKGQTVVHWMIDNEKTDLLEIVIMTESKDHQNSDNQTPAQYAQALGKTELVERISKIEKPSNTEFDLIDEQTLDIRMEMDSVRDFDGMKAN